MNLNMKVVFLFALALANIHAANILLIGTLASPSHHLWNKILSMALVERGHNVTMLSHGQEKTPQKNFTVITLEGAYKALYAHYNIENASKESVLWSIVSLYNTYLTFICSYDFQTKGFQTLMDYPKDYKFDLIIFDVTFGQCHYPFISRFHNPPVIGVTAFLLPPVLGYAFGNHLYTSYTPYYSTQFTNDMTLMERILNFIYIYFELFYRNYISTPNEYKLAQKRFGDNIPPLEEFERNMSILLSNVDPILDYPMSLPSNIIPVGGMHIKPAKELPQDLKTIVENAKHGIILFSLGTNVRSNDFKDEQISALLTAFSKLPQTILWKFESEELPNRPKNVIIRKWLPQNDILGHSNTRLFISHGGALSTQEAMYHGVPVIGMPFFIDQRANIGKMVNRNLAKFLDHTKLNSEVVYQTIKEVLDNPTFTKKMKDISSTYRDQPQPPMERAIFWIEYVLRHGTAEHLVPRARDMPFYQTANLDVLAVFGFGLVLIYALVVFLISVCRFAFVFKNSSSKSKTRTKK